MNIYFRIIDNLIYQKIFIIKSPWISSILNKLISNKKNFLKLKLYYINKSIFYIYLNLLLIYLFIHKFNKFISKN